MTGEDVSVVNLFTSLKIGHTKSTEKVHFTNVIRWLNMWIIALQVD